MRLFNAMERTAALCLKGGRAARTSDILESRGEMLAPDADGAVRAETLPKRIETVGFEDGGYGTQAGYFHRHRRHDY